MGHLAGKDIYRALGQKVDGLTMRVPWSEHLFRLLKELYTEEEAAFVAKMPYGLSSLEKVAQVTGHQPDQARVMLDQLSDKGLVLDISFDDAFYYQPSPMVIGIFEFTMMRTRGQLEHKEWAGLFSRYMQDGGFFAANDGQISTMRTLPWEGTLRPEEYSEILDHEKARHLVESASRWAVGICSCRHEKHHLGEKKCEVPLESCTSFDYSADFLVRHDMARDISKEEMLERVDRSWEAGLVLNADNVQRNATFICHCCKCCCVALAGVSRMGHPGVIVSSNYLAKIDHQQCTGCGNCMRDCPIEAISMVPSVEKKFAKNGRPAVDESFCLGCGVCTKRCKSKSLKLVHRAQRVLHPETTFERVILQCLERGTLQNQMFDDPGSKSQAFMRAFVGGFLRLSPVKKALMSDALRSRFLNKVKDSVRAQGKGFVVGL